MHTEKTPRENEDRYWGDAAEVRHTKGCQYMAEARKNTLKRFTLTSFRGN